MSLIKDLSKEKKQIDVRIKKITKTRLNDRSSGSWVSLRELNKANSSSSSKLIDTPF